MLQIDGVILRYCIKRLRSTRTCSWQTKYIGKLTVYFQHKTWQAWEEPMFHLVWMQERTIIPVQSTKAERVHSYLWEGQHFYSIQAFNCLDVAHHIRSKDSTCITFFSICLSLSLNKCLYVPPNFYILRFKVLCSGYGVNEQ